MSKILIKNGHVITADADATVLRGHDVLIEDGRIAAIGADLAADGAEVIDATEAIVMPGLIDTHMHMWEHAWRGLLVRKLGGPSYEDIFWPIRPAFTPKDTYESTLGCGLEMIDHGVTGVLDFFHGANSTSEHADAAAEAHQRSGQRVLLAYGMTAAYNIEDDALFEKARRERLEDFVRLRAEHPDQDAPLQIGLALATPRPKFFEGFVEELTRARSLGAQMSFHANEIGEFMAMHERGLLGPDIVPSHGNRASDRELGFLAETGVVLSISPQTETSSGKSLAVVNRAMRAGVDIAIGIDTPPSIMPLNLFAQMRSLFTYLTLLDNQAAREGGRFPIDLKLDPPTASLDDVFATATVKGAKALGLGDRLGTIETGKLADVIVVRPHDPDVTLADPVAYAVLSTPGKHEVEAVVIDGVVKKRDGRLVDVDPREVRAMNREVRQRVLTAIGRA
ncbi:amidohydrolase family protein [Microtetraspora niveoalba]|uniref:amidohydrolase family protein n=1 Tax=Microtetraspora niveoalba TaxID=46175 RepID=UPI000832D12D|nr:amidohydrolase family protein [Microtetraspora niveoalba]